MKNTSKRRLYYGIGTLGIVIIGLLSREIRVLPLFIGDMLYAVMIMMFLRALFLSLPLSKLVTASLCICYCIECSQLLSYDFLVQLRATLLGKLILGQGFLWSDIIAYTMGILLLAIVFQILEKNTFNQ